MITDTLNPLKLKFTEPTRVEEIILAEIRDTYKPDGWGLNLNNVMLEIGGHTGTLSMYCAKKYECKVYVYEPSPVNYKLLVENIRVNNLENLIFTYPYAITKDGRSMRMYQSPTNSGASNIYHGSEKRGDPMVSSVTLARAINGLREAGEFIQVLLMDCEGGEFELLDDLELLRGIPIMRGEFHQQFGDGKIDALLERIRTVIPDSNPYMQRNVRVPCK
jgi:FkbM family methyltransferase